MENSKKGPRSIKGNVLFLGLASFFTDISSEMTMKTLPLFLANVLGVKAQVIGLIEGVADTTATILKMFSGWFSDKVGKRKPLVVGGYALSALSKPFLYLATTWPFVLVLRFLERVGKGVRSSPKDALIADSTERHNQGKAFGFNRAMDNMGSVVGLLTAAAVVGLGFRGVVAMTRATFQTLVIVAVIPAFLAVFLLLGFVKDTAVAGEKRSVPKLSLSGFDSRFRIFLAIMILFTLGNSSDAFLMLRAQQLGMSLVHIFVILAVFSLVASLSSYPLGSLSDRVGRRKVIIAGWILYGMTYLGFALARPGWQIWALYALYGLYYGATDGVARALVADLVPSEKRGTAYGLFNAAIGIGALPASLIAGILWQKVSPSAPFLFGAALSLVAVAAMALFIRPARPQA